MPKMNISYGQRQSYKTKRFRDLEVGEVFIKVSQVGREDSCPHMKVKDCVRYEHHHCESQRFNAVSLRSGCQIKVCDSDDVVICSASLDVIKLKK